MTDDPWTHAVNLVLSSRTPTSRHIAHLIDDDVDDVRVATVNLKYTVLHSESSRRVTFRCLNPTLSVHTVYSQRRNNNESHRVSFTRLRISGHELAVETGRWNRRGRGRLPMNERLCPCGAVQTEIHVIQSCPRTQHIRDQYHFCTVDQLLELNEGTRIFKAVHDILRVFK